MKMMGRTQSDSDERPTVMQMQKETIRWTISGNQDQDEAGDKALTKENDERGDEYNEQSTVTKMRRDTMSMNTQR
jgi:hypothetical protein